MVGCSKKSSRFSRRPSDEMHRYRCRVARFVPIATAREHVGLRSSARESATSRASSLPFSFGAPYHEPGYPGQTHDARQPCGATGNITRTNETRGTSARAAQFRRRKSSRFRNATRPFTRQPNFRHVMLHDARQLQCPSRCKSQVLRDFGALGLFTRPRSTPNATFGIAARNRAFPRMTNGLSPLEIADAAVVENA